MPAMEPAALPTPTPRPLPPAPGFVKSAFRIFDLSLSEMLWSRRTIFMGLLVGAPVLFALLVRGLVFLGAPIFEGSQERVGVRTRCLVSGPYVICIVIWSLLYR